MRLARFPLAIGAACAAATVGLAAPARAESFSGEYGITLAGFPIGTADVKGSVSGRRYRLEVQARLTGLAGALTKGGAAATATGILTGPRPTPTSFALTSRSGSEQRTVRMALADGNVVAAEVKPPIDDKPDRVPVSDVHKRGVIDPVSALIMPAAARGALLDPANCNRTIPVFDGGARFNVILTYGGTRDIHKPGFSGRVLVCNARYMPVAGHRSERPATKFMQENRDMSVWLAPVESARLLVPLRIAVRTTIGMSVIEANRWTLDPELVPVAGDGARNAVVE